MVAIFWFYVVRIYGSGLGRYDRTKARRDLGSSWVTVFTLHDDIKQPNFLGFTDSNPFDTKHDDHSLG
jgi:hypothetical protein